MSQTIDNRIVEMQFENKQFESGVKESLSTLDKLKKALNFDDAAKNLTDFSKATKNFNLNDIGQNVEKIGEKFSVFGAVGFTAIQRLTNAAIDAGHKIGQILTAPIQQMKTGGWNRAMNIENAKFQLEGLGVAWETLYDDIDYAVSGTAYGLDAAAKAAAQLTASGVQAGESMKAALRGISGVAAMANTSYEEISPIFTTVAGQGKLMTMQLRQLESRGLNVAASLAKFFNQVNSGEVETSESVQKAVKNLTHGLNVSEASIRDFVQKGKINFDIFSAAMDGAFGEHAKDANKTFTGALSNVKAALSRIGAEFATPFMQNAIPVLNQVRLFINEIKKNMGGLFNIFANVTKLASNIFSGKIANAIDFLQNRFTGLNDIHNAFRNVLETVIKLFAALRSAFLEVFPQTKSFGDSINSAAKGLNAFTSKINPSKEFLLGFREVMITVFKVVKLFGTALKFVINLIGKIAPIVGRIISVLAKVVSYIANFINKLDLAKVAMTAISVLANLFVTVIEKIKAGLVILQATLNDTDSTLFKIINTIRNVVLIIIGSVILAISLLINKIKEVINFFKTNNIFGTFADNTKKFIDNLKELSLIEKIAYGVKVAIEAIGTAIGFVVGLFGKLIDGIKSLFSSEDDLRVVTKEVENSIAYAGNEVDVVVNTLTKGETKVNKITETFTKIRDTILNFVKAVKEKISGINVGEILLFSFGVAVTYVAIQLGRLMGSFTNLTKGFKDVTKSLSKFLKGFGKEKGGKSSFLEVMLGISLGLATLAGSLWVIAAIPVDKLNIAVATLGSFVVVIGALSLASAILGKGKNDFAASMMSFAGGIIVLLGSLILIDNIKIKNILNDVIMLGAICAAMLVISAILAKVAPSFSKGGLAILMCAGGILILAQSLKIISEANLSSIGANWKALTAIILAFAVFAGLASNIGIGAGIGLLSFIGILWLLIKNFKKVEEHIGELESIIEFVISYLKRSASYIYDAIKQVAKDIEDSKILAAVLVGGVLSIIGIIFAIGKAGKGIKKISFGITLVVAAIAGLMWVTVQIAKLMEQVKASNIDKSIELLTRLLIFVGIIMGFASVSGVIGAKLKQSSNNKMLRDLRKVIVSMGILLLSIGAFASMIGSLSEAQFDRARTVLYGALIIVGIISAITAAITSKISNLGDARTSFGTFAGIILLIGSLVGSFAVLMYLFSQVDWQRDWPIVLAATLALTGIVISICSILSNVAEINKYAKLNKGQEEMKAPFRFLMGILLEIGLLIGAMAYLNLDPTIMAGQALVLVGALAIVSFIAVRLITSIKNLNLKKEHIDIIKKTFGCIKTLVYLLIPLALIFGVLQKFGVEWVNMAQNAATLVGVLGAISFIVISIEKVSKKLGLSNAEIDNLDQTFDYIKSFIISVCGLGLVFGLMQHFGVDWSAMLKYASVLVGIIVVISTIVMAIEGISKKMKLTKANMDKIDQTFDYIKMLMLSIVGLGLVFGLMQHFGVDWTIMLKEAAILVGIIVVISTIVMTIEGISKKLKLSKTEMRKIQETFILIGSLLLAIVALAAIFYAIRNLNAKTMALQAAVLVGIILGISTIVVSIQAISKKLNISKDRMLKIRETFITIGALLLSIVALAATFYAIRNLDVKTMALQATILGLLLLELTALAIGLNKFIKAGSLLDASKGPIIVLELVGIFELLVLIFGQIQKINTEGLMGKAQTIMLVLAELVAIALILGKMSGTIITGGVSSLLLLPLVGIFELLVLIFGQIQKLNTDKLMGKAQTIMLVLVELAAIASILGLLNAIPALGGVVSIALLPLVGIFELLVLIFGQIQKLNIDKLMGKCQTIMLVLVELVAIASILGLLSALPALGGVVSLALLPLVGIFELLVLIFGQIQRLNTDKLMGKCQTIVLVLVEFVAIASIIGLLAPLVGIGGLVSLALIPLVGVFYLLSLVFEQIQKLNLDGLLAKSQIIVLVLFELSLISGFGILGLGTLIGGSGVKALVEIFGDLVLVFNKIQEINVDGLLIKSQIIVLVLFELSLLSGLAILGVGAKIGGEGVSAMVDIFDKLLILFPKINQLQIDEGIKDKINLIMWTLFKLELLSLLAILGKIGEEGIPAVANMIVLFDMMIGMFGKINSLVATSVNIDAVEQIIKRLVTTIAELTALGFINGVLGFIGPGLEALGNGIRALGQGCGDASPGIVAFADAITKLKDALNNESSIGTAIENIKTKVTTGFNFEPSTPIKWGKDLVANFAAGINSGASSEGGSGGGLIGALKNIGATIKAYIGHSNPIMGWLAGGVEQIWGNHLVQNFVSGMIEAAPKAKEGAMAIGNAITKYLGIDLTSIMGQYGSAASNNFANGLFSGLPAIESYSNSVINSLFGIQNAIASISSSWARGYGTLSDYQYQLTTEISGQEKKIDRLRGAYKRLGETSSTTARSLSKEIRATQDEINDTKKRLDNIGKASSDVDKLANSFNGLSNSIGGGGGGGGGAAGALKDFESELAGVLEGQMNIFQKFEEKTAMSKEELLSNMRSQIEGMTKWASNMQILAAKGIDQGLYEELAMMGPQGAEYVGAFVDMTAEELAQANSLWAQSLVLPKNVAKTVSTSFNSIGQNLMAGEKAGIIAATPDVAAEMANSQNTIKASAETTMGINSPSTVFMAIGEFLMLGLYKGIQEEERLPKQAMLEVCRHIIDAAEDSLKQDKFYTIGKNVLLGISEGLSDPDALAEIIAKLKALSAMMEGAEKENEEMHSPSRKWARFGRFLMLGLAVGIEDNTYEVLNSIDQMSDVAYESMRDTISNIGNRLVEDIDDPVIRPVLDLSNVQAGARTLNNLFSTNQALKASASFDNLQNEQSDRARLGTTFIQNNYSPKALSRTEIYRQTKNQFSAYREAFS